MTTGIKEPPAKAKAEKPANAYVTIVLDPSRDKRTGPYRFPFMIEVPPRGREKEPTVEVSGLWLTPGTNEVAIADYENMRKSEFWTRCVNKGVVKVYEPQAAETLTRTSADYSPEDAIAIIEESSDEKWLERCMNKDSRDGIIEACQERIKTIKENLKAMQAAQGEE